MSPRRSMARSIALLAGMISLVATVVSLLYGQRLAAPETTGVDAFSNGPLGHRALTEVYEELGTHVLVDREGVYESAGAPVFFVEPQSVVFYRGEPIDLPLVLRERAYAGRDSVVVLPKWRVDLDVDDSLGIRSDKAEVEWMMHVALDWAAAELRREDIDIPETAMLREWTVPGRHGPRHVVLQERQTMRLHESADDIEVLLGTRSSALIVAVHPRGATGVVIVVSDPDLLHNFNLHRGDHARIALDLLEDLHTDTVVIDEVMHGHGYELTLGAVLGRFPAVLLVGHALLLALLYAWAGMRPFGSAPVARPQRQSTRALVELAARALATGVRRGRGLTVSYVCIVISDIADRLGISPAPVLGARAHAIDEIATRRGIAGGALAIVAEISALQGLQRPLLQIVRDVHRLRTRVLSQKGTR